VRISAGHQALFQLGEELVGVDPDRMQAMILSLTSEFLQSLEPAAAGAVPLQRRRLGGVTAYVLDRPLTLEWLSTLSLPTAN
jgi:hypothetical protein